MRSVHRAAIYVDLVSSDGLLVVAIAAVGGIPGGILVGDVTDLRDTGIRPGMAFGPSADGFAVPAAGVAIDLTRARPWSPILPPAARVRMTAAVDRAVATARGLAAARAPAGGLAPLLGGGAGADDPWVARGWTLVRAQLAALTIGDVASALAPTIGLIGLGVGLTPSGDDYLIGLLAGLRATGDPVRHELAAGIAAHAPDRTTAIGAAALAHAARGAFAERLHDVLVAIADGRPDAIAAAVEGAMDYGATSGSDTLVGLFSALDLAHARSVRVPRAAA